MVDAPVLGTGAFGVRVRISSRPNKNNNPFRVVVFIICRVNFYKFKKFFIGAKNCTLQTTNLNIVIILFMTFAIKIRTFSVFKV